MDYPASMTSTKGEKDEVNVEISRMLDEISSGVASPKAIDVGYIDLSFDLASPWMSDGVRRMHSESQRLLSEMAAARYKAKKGAGPMANALRTFGMRQDSPCACYRQAV